METKLQLQIFRKYGSIINENVIEAPLMSRGVIGGLKVESLKFDLTLINDFLSL